MFTMVLTLWFTGKINEPKLNEYVARGLITQDEANLILATPQKQ
jgi:hypothetical protein